MPNIKIEDKVIYVPDTMLGRNFRNLPVVREKVRAKDEVMLTRGDETTSIVDDAEYEIRDGDEVEWYSPSTSGRS